MSGGRIILPSSGTATPETMDVHVGGVPVTAFAKPGLGHIFDPKDPNIDIVATLASFCSQTSMLMHALFREAHATQGRMLELETENLKLQKQVADLQKKSEG